jgi:Fe-S-cluster containining protein
LTETSAPLPAGNFSQWLRDMRAALSSRGGMNVACGDCRGCCVSAYYVKVRAHETGALARIGAENLEPGPPGDPGTRLMGFQSNGHCLMLRDGNCSIYPDRPETCRSYDCRVFTAAGMKAGADKPVINLRVARWAFEYPTERDRDEQRAVSAAASYLRQHPVRFPGGHVPSRPSEVAVLAVKAYTVFLDPPDTDTGISAAMVAAIQEFDRIAGAIPAEPIPTEET